MSDERKIDWPPERSLEDFRQGDFIISPRRTIDIADIKLFAGLTGDFYPLHVDDTFCQDTPFGERIAHGPLTFGIATGLVFQSGYYGMMIQAMLECRELRALRPVRPGDTIHVKATVRDISEWKKPGLGKFTVEYLVFNQNDEEVMIYTMVMLARKRNKGED